MRFGQTPSTGTQLPPLDTNTPYSNMFSLGKASIVLGFLLLGWYGINSYRRYHALGKVRRWEREALYHETKAEEKLARAKAVALKAGLSKKTIRRLTDEGKTDSQKAAKLKGAVQEQRRQDEDYGDVFQEVVQSANVEAGPRTGPQGSRPTNQWRSAYKRLARRAEQESDGSLVLPEPGTETFRRMLRDYDL